MTADSRLKRHSFRGFSLIELAVVLMIIGTLMSGVLVAVSQSTANARITNAKAQLREIEEALYGYAQAYGRLPCPTTPASGTAGFEDPVGGSSCTVWHGFVPYATLGITGSINDDGLLLDPWQNPFRYSVASYAYAGTPSFTNATALDTLFNTPAALAAITGFIDHTNMLQVCDSVACTGNVYVNSAPAVILSMGSNWATYTSTEEQQNTGDGSTTLSGTNTYNVTASNEFVSTTYSEENFDDQLVWISPYVLFNRLVSAGKLP